MKSRLFIAIALPEELRSSVAALQSKLNKLNLPVIWEPLEKIHLTLNYVGRLTREEVYPVKKAIQTVCQNHASFELAFAHLETLYQRHDESLIYLSPGKSEQLKQLQDSLVHELNTLDHPQPRKFTPHFTIGRLKRTDPIVTKQAIDKLIHLDLQLELEPMTVNKITLFESLISSKGSTYQGVAEYMLQS